MEKLSILTVCLVWLCSLAVAEKYPVDDEIEALMVKANHLKSLKELYGAHRCAVSVDGSTVHLTPGALRGNGLVIAIGGGFPNNYLAYEMAPKPQMLERVIEHTFLKKGSGQGAVIVTGTLGYPSGSSKPSHLAIYVNEPLKVQGAEDLWIYQKTGLVVKIPVSSERVEAVAETFRHGRAIFFCN